MSSEFQKPPTLSEAASQYLALLSGAQQRESQQEVNRFVRWLGSTRSLDRLFSHEVSTFAGTLGTSTANPLKKLEPVKAFLAWAKKEGFTETNLGTSLRPAKSRLRDAPKVRKAGPDERALLTQDGYQQLGEELENLRAERPRMAETLRLAREDKDFRENAPLDAARDQQAHMEARIRELESLVKRADVLGDGASESVRSQIGSTVVVRELDTGDELRFTLVHPREVNLAQGKLSIASPLGKAMLERAAGENIKVDAPAGVQHYRIQRVEPRS